ncbi:MAG: isocitrate/isopropylmalate dehydrogenase family protein [Deltaproteobacteria bacterium]|nr:isocitrate/isopropylmalate dehydrogenase family protein [Deltaproteobacteria bacterium]
MAYDVVLLPGDGIGVEVMREGRLVLEEVAARTSARFEYTTIACGGQHYLEHGRDWPEGSEARCSAADVIFLGAVGWPSPSGRGPVTMADGKMAGWSPVIGNRTRLDLYANIRPVKLLAGVTHRVHGQHRQVWEPGKVDMVIVRENTEGLYCGVGGFLGAGDARAGAIDTRLISRSASERVIRKAFELSRARNGAPKDGKKRVTCIAKDNVLRGCQLFVEVFEQVGRDYPDIEKDYAIVDAFTQWLITQPEFYDVCVTTNMFGDIVTDLASVLQGGMGVAVGCNVGDHHAMFEPIHGSAPKYTGKDKANPIAMILAVAEGLRWLGRRKDDAVLVRAAAAVEGAVADTVREGKTLTYDLAGEERASPMSKVGEAIRLALAARLRD